MQKLKLFAGSFLTALFFSALGQAQTILIVSGSGQLVCPDCPVNPQKYAPLVVQVNDATGKPVANTTVTWTTSQSGDTTLTATSVTDSIGQATLTFTPPPLTGVSDFYSATVIATALNASVTFYETTAVPAGAGTTGASVSLIPVSSPPVESGVPGSTAPAIMVSVLGQYGGLPNIQVTLQSQTTGLTISCETQTGQQSGTVLTNSSGQATCTPLFGNKLGSGEYIILVGVSYASFSQTPFSVVPGPPAIIKVVSGSGQTVNAGTLAPQSLVAQVTDAGGNPSSKAAVKWSVTGGAATLGNIVSSSLSNGDVSVWVTPTAGPVQVTVALANNSAVQAIFTINVNTIVTALQTISGNTQQIKEGTAFANPLIVQVNDNTTPVPGATVNFAVTSGPATLSAASAVTNAQGQAQVTATAGATAGQVMITASVKCGTATCSQTFILTVNTPGFVTSSIVNAAGFQSQFVSPCSLATIYGTGLAPGLQGVASAMIAPQTLVSGVTVQFGGVLAPILYVANINGQESVSVQVPCEVPASSAVPPATVPMVVTVNNVASTPFDVTVLPISPGIFQFTDTDGLIRAVLVRQDGTFINVANPARPGDTLRMFVTGLGQTTPALFTDEFDPLVEVGTNWAPQDLPVNVGVVVGVNNAGVLVLSAKYAYGMVGVYEVEFQVPVNTAAGNSAPFAIAVYQGVNLLFGNGSLIPIQ